MTIYESGDQTGDLENGYLKNAKFMCKHRKMDT